MSEKQKIFVTAGNQGLLVDWGELLRQRDVFLFLVWRDILVRYKQTLLGATWAILKPLLSMIVFTVFLGLVSRFPSDGLPYPVFYFSALTLWSYFSSAVLMSGDSLIGNAPLLTRVYVPRIFIPAAPICSGLVDLVLSLALLSVLTALYGYPPTAGLLIVPAVIVIVTVTALGTGLLMSPLIVRYRDFQNVMGIVIQVWMFVSPVIYPSSLVPDKWRLIYSLNPLAGAIEGLRWAICGIGKPPWLSLTVGFISGLLILVAGLIHFRKTEEYFADYV